MEIDLPLEITNDDRVVIKRGLDNKLSPAMIAAGLIFSDTGTLLQSEVRSFGGILGYKGNEEDLDRDNRNFLIINHYKGAAMQVLGIEKRRKELSSTELQVNEVLKKGILSLESALDAFQDEYNALAIEVGLASQEEVLGQEERETNRLTDAIMSESRNRCLDQMAGYYSSEEIIDFLAEEGIKKLVLAGGLQYSEDQVADLICATEMGRLRFRFIHDEAVKMSAS